MKRGFISSGILIGAALVVLAVMSFSNMVGTKAAIDLKYNELSSQIDSLWKNIASGENTSLFGAFRPSGYVGKLLTRLDEGGSESTFNTTPCTTPDGQTILAGAIGDFIVITINPGSDNEEKISASSVSCSGTTLTWTVANRGLSFASPTSTIAANKNQHAIGERVIISNDDQFTYTQYVDVDSAQTIGGQKTFTQGALFSVAASSTNECDSNTEYCTKLYIDATANQGAATSTETNGGIVELATALETASSTDLGTTRPLVLQAKYATDTPQVGCGSGYSATAGAACSVIARLTGKISQAWIDLTENFTWTGLHIFGNASSTRMSIFDTLYVGGSATSTIQGSTTGTSTIQGYLNVSGNSNSTSTISSKLLVSATTTLTGCSGCLSGYERVQTQGAMQTSNGQTTTITSSCSTGKKVIGGGYETPGTASFLDDSTDGYDVNFNAPSSDTAWTVKYFCSTGGTCDAGFATTTAVCVYP